MLLLADCAKKFSDQKKLKKLHKILVIATFPALGFLVLLKMFKKMSCQENLNEVKIGFAPLRHIS